ncbi:hypothetical protein NC797_14345 [Aquibacillus sp. 3ASR75-11]|uniref:Uncharacterized protein n=1 Tax=Terrihalobacillus insolitus TaxID=2950438 RepID=A0A9X3WYF1_9BACI|nr:hypothetical protein [Terrihalobacillus insolitus]MDC3413262.1 hypothetical protein [Terrihalobacillus insolitus]MDC3425684.1 hypothetical protein [Terrihalobacillus insolitus]
MILPFLPYLIELVLFLIGIYFIALGVWEHKLGTNKKHLITFFLIGALFIAISQSFLELWELYKLLYSQAN